MPLVPGRTLLHFRLLERIGAGGMGEVWRALDATLDREVAIKVLPQTLANDPERIARFEREARVLASLNHPNIAAVYGFPEAEGIRFLAMELVRGEDLAQALARGPLPVREAIEAAQQIAAALEAAHDSGVVHRDLKPANVRRTPEGQVKVLDFGLAKALEVAAPSSGHTATVTSAGSVAGMILGTASYMSPEQARGLAVDRRTDLWAFGCLLFEMLAGKKAFDGPTVTDVLAAVIQGEPDWDALPPHCPASVRRLLRRCLEKEPRKRLRDAGDASLLLEANPEDARTAPVPRVPVRRPWLLAALVLGAVTAAGAGGYWLGGEAGRGASLEGVSFRRVTFGRGMMRAARFAPDGQTFVYGAAWDGPPVRLYLARTDSTEATALPLPPAELLAVASTGEMAVAVGLAYRGWMGEGTLARAPLLGGTHREILERVRHADFSPDGSGLAVVRRVEGFEQLEYPAGTVLYRTSGYIADPRVSPDGERVAFTDHPVWADDRGGVAVVDRSGRKTTLAAGLESVHGVAWAPGGAEVWYTGRGDEGWVLRASDPAGGSRTVYKSMTPFELFDIAADGRLLVGTQRAERQVSALLAGWDGPRPLTVPGESSVARGLSADGKAVLVTNQVPAGYETYLVRADRPGAVRLSSGDGYAISADGAWGLAVSADARSMLLSPLGPGTTRTFPIPGNLACDSAPSLLPDGTRIVFVGRRGSEPSRAYLLDVAGEKVTPFAAPGVFWALFGGIPVSPDGSSVVLQDASGTFTRWPLQGGKPLPIPGLAEEEMPLTWAADGRGIFVAGRGVPIPIERLDLATGRRTPWMTVAPPDQAGLRMAVASITPDGRHWALSTSRLLTDLYVVEGLR